MRPLIIVAISSLVVVASADAFAGPRDFVVSVSGFLGTKGQAAPVLEKVFRRLEGPMSWPEGAMSFSYHPDGAEGLASIRRDLPGFGVVSHEIYAVHGRKMGMQVIAAMELSGGAMSRFHVVTKAKAATSVTDLVGKTIASVHLGETRFAERVIFGGKLRLGPGGATAIHALTPLSSLRMVARGQADAAVVDESVVQVFSKLPYTEGLEVIYSTATLPPLPVVAFASTSASARTAMAKALESLCAQGEGQALCRSARIASFRRAGGDDFAALEKQLR